MSFHDADSFAGNYGVLGVLGMGGKVAWLPFELFMVLSGFDEAPQSFYLQLLMPELAFNQLLRICSICYSPGGVVYMYSYEIRCKQGLRQ